jgi:hypothetical protein
MILIERLTPKKRLLGYNTDGILVARECVECKEFLCISNYSRHVGTNLGYNTRCKPCMKTPDKVEKRNTGKRDRRRKDPETNLQKKREYNNKTKQKRSQVHKIWAAKNKSKLALQSNNWKKRNYDHIYDYNRKREMLKKGCEIQLPISCQNEIKKIYKDCKNLNTNSSVKYSVDHIIPIKNNNVCGLHVPWNLTIITKSENSSKKNKFDFTYDNNSWRNSYEK